MKKIQIITAFLAAAIGFCSCNPTTLLTTNFSTDIINSLPAKNISGAPDGDSIRYAREIEPKIRVVASERAGEKVLKYTNVGADRNNQTTPGIEFKAIPTSFENRVWFLCTGKHRGTSGTIFLSVTDGYGKEIAWAGIGAAYGGIILPGRSTSQADSMGFTLPGERHTIVFSVDMTGGTYNVTIFKPSGTITANNRPLLNPVTSYRNPANPTLTVKFQWFHGSNDREYTIEKVLISRNEPDVR